MANSARNAAESEFWRPPVHERAPTAPAAQSDACEHCGTDLVAGSRFCHVCGCARGTHSTGTPRLNLAPYLVWARIKDGLGLGSGPLIALFAGTVCVLGALFTGMVYSATTALDWQAVQFWRSEWLLAGMAAFMAGILLKRNV